MKKLLVILALLAFAATSFAVELKLSGDFYVRGSYISIDTDETNGVDEKYSYYDQDMNLWAKLVVDENTWVTTRFAIHDENWKDDSEDEADDDFTAERVWMTHKFSTGTTLDAGLMTGAGWGTAFGNDTGGKYRIKFTQALPYGSLVAFVQKNTEKGAELKYKDAEKDDSDTYGLGANIKAGDFKIMPLVTYMNNSAKYLDNGTDAQKTWRADVAFTGKVGMVGFEGEFSYVTMNDDDNSSLDFDVYGVYLNGYAMVDKVKVGAIVAYGSYDKDAKKGYDFEDDFDSTLVLGDWLQLGDDYAYGYGTKGESDLVGMTLLQLYAKTNVTDKLSVNASLSYVFSNQEDNEYEDVKAYEVDLGASYAITKNLTYSLAFGYAQVKDIIENNGLTDEDKFDLKAIRAYHKIALTF
ncbi:hypothetical protein OWM07_00350 [Deferribacter thermophilus]|uniref:hypothetical protein n=1 Tax=Deferribacter thermophilus TaxID=53573 RepID=UPI003C25C6DE